jgi:hypothetical protein
MRPYKNSREMFFPQNQKDKMLEALTTLTKPQSSKWEDFEIWWNQLNVQDKGKVMSDFFIGFTCGCPLEDASEMTTWDNRLLVVDQFPLFNNIPRDPFLSRSIRQFMDYTDEKGRIKIFQLRI